MFCRLGSNMVRLHVKKGDESLFLYDTTVEIPVEQLQQEIVPIYNGRLKVLRICAGKTSEDQNFKSVIFVTFSILILKL